MDWRQARVRAGMSLNDAAEKTTLHRDRIKAIEGGEPPSDLDEALLTDAYKQHKESAIIPIGETTAPSIGEDGTYNVCLVAELESGEQRPISHLAYSPDGGFVYIQDLYGAVVAIPASFIDGLIDGLGSFREQIANDGITFQESVTWMRRMMERELQKGGERPEAFKQQLDALVPSTKQQVQPPTTKHPPAKQPPTTKRPAKEPQGLAEFEDFFKGFMQG